MPPLLALTNSLFLSLLVSSLTAYCGGGSAASKTQLVFHPFLRTLHSEIMQHRGTTIVTPPSPLTHYLSHSSLSHSVFLISVVDNRSQQPLLSKCDNRIVSRLSMPRAVGQHLYTFLPVTERAGQERMHFHFFFSSKFLIRDHGAKPLSAEQASKGRVRRRIDRFFTSSIAYFVDFYLRVPPCSPHAELFNEMWAVVSYIILRPRPWFILESRLT